VSKKTFAAAPMPRQPTAEEIDAYEKNGAGHDRQSAPAVAPTPAMATPAEPTKRLSLDLPASVHTRFKTACSATGRKMVGEIHDFIERRIAELESEAGISRK
jgi:hypothetical protein